MEDLAARVSAANIRNWRGGGGVRSEHTKLARSEGVRSEGCGNASPNVHPLGGVSGRDQPDWQPGLATGVAAQESRRPVAAPTLGDQRPTTLLPRAPVRQTSHLIPRRKSHRGNTGAFLDDTERPAFAQDTRHRTAEVTDQVGLVNDQQRTHGEVSH